MIPAGQLDRRITILKPGSFGDDGYGNDVPSWDDYRTVWARVTQPLGREVVASGRVGEQSTATVLLRDSTEIRAVTTKDAVRYAGEVWNIRSGPVPLVKYHGFVELLIERGVAVGGAE